MQTLRNTVKDNASFSEKAANKFSEYKLPQSGLIANPPNMNAFRIILALAKIICIKKRTKTCAKDTYCLIPIHPNFFKLIVDSV